MSQAASRRSPTPQFGARPACWTSGQVSRHPGEAHDRSGYVHYAWTPAAQLTISPGVRVTGGSAFPGAVVSRWVLGEWRLRPGWALHASTGISHQEAAAAPGSGVPARGAGPERAALADVGVEHQLTPALRWQATLFARDDTVVDRWPAEPRLPDTGAAGGTLRGRARGVELLVQRDAGSRLSGWLSYSFGRTRYTDAARGETFWADFDRRHAVNALAAWRLTDRVNIGATLRAGSNFPIPGRFAARDGTLFLATRRNAVRLPPYARLDLRADYALPSRGRRLTLFAEVINVTNRPNVGLADGTVRPDGEAVGFTTALFPRRLTAGVLIEF